MIQVTSHLLLTGILGVKYLELFIDSAPGCHDALYVKGKHQEAHQAFSEPSPHALVTQKPGFQQRMFSNKARKLSGSITDGLRNHFSIASRHFLWILPETKCFKTFSSPEASLNKWSLMVAGGWTNSYVLLWGMGELTNTPLNSIKKLVICLMINHFIILIKTR